MACILNRFLHIEHPCSPCGPAQKVLRPLPYKVPPQVRQAHNISNNRHPFPSLYLRHLAITPYLLFTVSKRAIPAALVVAGPLIGICVDLIVAYSLDSW